MDPQLSLLDGIVQKQETALSSLYDGVSPRVYGLAMRILRDEQAAEEATMETFTEVWNRASSYNPERGSVQTWVLMIARSRSIDLLRRRQRHQRREVDLEAITSLPDSAPGPEEQSIDSDRARLVHQALTALSPDQRHAVEAAFFCGLSHSEVAHLLEQPLGTVKTRIRSGLQKLREVLEPVEGGLW